MHHFHSFLNAIWFSCTSPATYRAQFIKESWRQSLWYLYFFLVILTAAKNLPLALSLIRAVPSTEIAIRTFEEEGPSIFPKNLVITIKNGVAQTNVREPFAISLPKQWMNSLNTAFPETPEFKSFLLLHTRAKADDFPLYRSVLLLTRNSLVVNEQGRNFRTISLRDFPSDLTIDATTVAKTLHRASRFLNVLPELFYASALLMVFLLPFIKAFLLGIGYLFLLLPLSLFPLALAIHLGKHLSFVSIYRFSLHALTLPILFRTIELPIFSVRLPFSLACLYLLFVSMIICQFPRWKPTNPSFTRPKTNRRPLPPPPEIV